MKYVRLSEPKAGSAPPTSGQLLDEALTSTPAGRSPISSRAWAALGPEATGRSVKVLATDRALGLKLFFNV